MRNWHEVRCTLRSIVDSFGVPAIHVNVVINPVQRIQDLDLPFFPTPPRRPPPGSLLFPRPGFCCCRPMHAMKSNPDGTTRAELDGRVEGRAEAAKSD